MDPIEEAARDRARETFAAHRSRVGLALLVLAFACMFQAGRACAEPDAPPSPERR